VPLEVIFRNLLDNAIKHHHRPAEGHVYISAQTQASWVAFTVTDDGPGIAPQFHERIFQVFQTLKPREEVEGSGMGLAVVKKMIENRAGQIWLESSEGQGATFHFTWPTVSAANA
jgi:signal transduction histidine kinase